MEWPVKKPPLYKRTYAAQISISASIVHSPNSTGIRADEDGTFCMNGEISDEDSFKNPEKSMPFDQFEA